MFQTGKADAGQTFLYSRKHHVRFFQKLIDFPICPIEAYPDFNNSVPSIICEVILNIHLIAIA